MPHLWELPETLDTRCYAQIEEHHLCQRPLVGFHHFHYLFQFGYWATLVFCAITRGIVRGGEFHMNQKLNLTLALLTGLLGGLFSQYVAPARVRAQAPDAPTVIN